MLAPLLLTLGACGPTVHWRAVATAPAHAAGCCPVLINEGDPVPVRAEFLGEVSYGETGFSVKCSRTQNLERARQKACTIGADIVKVQSIRGNLWSSCDYVTAALYRLPERPQMEGAAGAPVTDGTALCNDRYALRPRDERGDSPARTSSPSNTASVPAVAGDTR